MADEKKKTGKHLNRPKKRVLVRWSNELDEKLLLSVQAVCNAKNIKIPWADVAEVMGENVTEGAIVQHLAKLRQRRVEAGQDVPPPLRRGGAAKPTPTKRSAESNKNSTSEQLSKAPVKGAKRTKRKKAAETDSETDSESGIPYEDHSSDEEYGGRSRKGGGRKSQRKVTESSQTEAEEDVDQDMLNVQGELLLPGANFLSLPNDRALSGSPVESDTLAHFADSSQPVAELQGHYPVHGVRMDGYQTLESQGNQQGCSIPYTGSHPMYQHRTSHAMFVGGQMQTDRDELETNAAFTGANEALSHAVNNTGLDIAAFHGANDSYLVNNNNVVGNVAFRGANDSYLANNNGIGNVAFHGEDSGTGLFSSAFEAEMYADGNDESWVEWKPTPMGPSANNAAGTAVVNDPQLNFHGMVEPQQPAQNALQQPGQDKPRKQQRRNPPKSLLDSFNPNEFKQHLEEWQHIKEQGVGLYEKYCRLAKEHEEEMAKKKKDQS